MFKQENPKFTYVTDKNTFKEFRDDEGIWIYGRKIEIMLEQWNYGNYMQITIYDLKSNLEKGNYQEKIFSQEIYDKMETMTDFHDRNILAALTVNQFNRNHAEYFISYLVAKYCQEIFKEFFPLIYEFWKTNGTN
ncbi:MAG TPA: hypothetical protein PLL26_02680 [Candidatus Dojkabacteria bacterium]|nr:hypothetical protein [Candidatus Dojkabacteria bacterium]